MERVGFVVMKRPPIGGEPRSAEGQRIGDPPCSLADVKYMLTAVCNRSGCVDAIVTCPPLPTNESGRLWGPLPPSMPTLVAQPTGLCKSTMGGTSSGAPRARESSSYLGDVKLSGPPLGGLVLFVDRSEGHFL